MDLSDLPASALVLDVGGWAAPNPRADWVIDVLPFETRNWFYNVRGETPPDCRVTGETWVQMDICSSSPWPFEDDAFDFVLCTQTLEDVRDPVRVCEEMSRVGRAGYVASPGPAVELTRGIESPYWCGWRHHRWLVELDDDGVVFLAKPHHVHSPLWPAIRSPRLLHPDALLFEHEWRGALPAREDVLVESEPLDDRLLAIIRRSARRDPVEPARVAARKARRGYRALRRAAGRVMRSIASSR